MPSKFTAKQIAEAALEELEKCVDADRLYRPRRKNLTERLVDNSQRLHFSDLRCPRKHDTLGSYTRRISSKSVLALWETLSKEKGELGFVQLESLVSCDSFSAFKVVCGKPISLRVSIADNIYARKKRLETLLRMDVLCLLKR